MELQFELGQPQHLKTKFETTDSSKFMYIHGGLRIRRHLLHLHPFPLQSCLPTATQPFNLRTSLPSKQKIPLPLRLCRWLLILMISLFVFIFGLACKDLLMDQCADDLNMVTKIRESKPDTIPHQFHTTVWSGT